MKKNLMLTILISVFVFSGCDSELKEQNNDDNSSEQVILKQITAKEDQKNNLEEYKNLKLGYSFGYPSNEYKIGYNEQFHYQFLVDDISFNTKVFVDIEYNSIEEWIQDSKISKVSSDLSKYSKIMIDGQNAYQFVDSAFVYVMANRNVYELNANSGGPAPLLSSDPLFKKWLGTIQFIK